MKRIQRKRTKGWKMPENAVYVGRPTIWGNPFRLDELGISEELSLELYRKLFTGWDPKHILDCNADLSARIYKIHCAWGERFHRNIGAHPLEYAKSVLSWRDLACWCSLSNPCHADVLIELLEES